MRTLFRRKGVRIITAIVSLTAIGIVVTPGPALAAGIPICNTNGNMYCIGAPTIGIGDPVKLTVTGRIINLHDRGYTCCGGHEVFQLQFDADRSKCVGLPTNLSANNTVVRYCSSGNDGGVNWAVELPASGPGVYFYSNRNGAWLASNNSLNGSL